MEWAPVTELGANLGRQKGALEVNGNTVEWKRFGFVYRQFTFKTRVHCASFVHYANCSNPDELWVVIVGHDRLVHSYGLSSGKTHVMGLDSLPKNATPCGKHGLIFTFVDKTHLSVKLLQGPEELLSAVTPSSVSAPWRSQDELLFCDSNVALIWNPNHHVVRAFALRILNRVTQVNHINGESRSAVFSPLREWTQSSVGKVFSQRLEIGSELSLVAVHDPDQDHLYVLCGPDLLRHEGIKHVAPVAGVHRFPLVAWYSSETAKLSFTCLFFPEFNSLLVPLENDAAAVVDIRSEQESNWIELEFPGNETSRIALCASLSRTVSLCLDIVLELLRPSESAVWIAIFLSNKAQNNNGGNNDMEAFADTLANLAEELNPNTLARIICYLHILREELRLLTTHGDVLDELTNLIAPYVSSWGGDWSATYSNREEVSRGGSLSSSGAAAGTAAGTAAGAGVGVAGATTASGGNGSGIDTNTTATSSSAFPREIPEMLESCPNVFGALASCTDQVNLTNALPDLANNERLFPNIVQLVTLFQLISISAAPEDVVAYIDAAGIPQKLEQYSPGIRTCLLEIMSYLGMNPYDKTQQVLPTRDANSSTSDELAHQRDRILKGLFPNDLRYNEALRLLQSDRPQSCLFGIYFNPKSLAESTYARMQKAWGTALAHRALDTAYGKAALTMGSLRPLLWEQLEPPIIDFGGECTETGLSVSPVAKTIKQAAELDPWGVFAHGAALGLSISPKSPGIDSLWVITSAQLNSSSADLYSGFVFGMGLSGHLANLEDWQFYESLVSSDKRGTLAALLGVAASKRGSRDAKLTKVLLVHVRALLPVEAHDTHLVPSEVERAAVLSLGLLYMETGVRHLTEALIRELEWIPAQQQQQQQHEQQQSQPHQPQHQQLLLEGELSEHNEAHKLSVGITLGLINLGLGKSSGLDQLLHFVTGFYDHSVYSAEITSGAICAIFLSYVGSNDQLIADQIFPPSAPAAAKYNSPHLFFARALSHHLILWDKIGKTEEWVNSNVSPQLRKQKYNSEDSSAGAATASTRVDGLWYYYALAGVLTAMSMRHAASNDPVVIQTLLYFIENEFYKPYLEVIAKLGLIEAATTHGKGVDYDLMQTAHHLALLISSLSLALGVSAAGSGNLAALRLLRKLWQIDPQVQASLYEGNCDTAPLLMGSEDAAIDLSCVAQAIGWLFMCGSKRSFKTDPKSIGFLTVFTFHRVLGGPNISELDWKHLRFLWCLVTELRCLYSRSDPAESVEVEIELVSGDMLHSKMPVTLPSLDQVRSVRVTDARYVAQRIEKEELMTVLQNGVQVVAKDTGRYTLEALLPSIKPKLDPDSLPIKALRATLQTVAKHPANQDELEDLNLLLKFADKWPVDDQVRLLKRRDLEQLKLLRWCA